MTRISDRSRLYVPRDRPQIDEHNAENMRSISSWANRLGKWTTWTPLITQSNTPTYTVDYAKYMVIGDTVWLTVHVIFTSAGTAGSEVRVTNLPSPGLAVGQSSLTPTRLCVGSFDYVRPGVANRAGDTIFIDMNTIQFTVDSTTAQFGASPGVTIQNGDELTFSCCYEARNA